MGLPSPEVLDREYQRALDQGAVQPYAEEAKGGFTGVIGILDCGEGPVVALRFDIDALGVRESAEESHRPRREGFSSVNPGVMHACGHDGHAAIGLAVAKILMEYKDFLHVKIKLIFQPAEEGVRGAKSIVAHGHLDDVDYVIGNHLVVKNDSSADILLPLGATMATTKLDVRFTGLAFHAGTGRNVICDQADITLEVRGSTTEANQYMEAYARRIIAAAAEMHGCTYEITVMGASESLQNDPELMEWCQKCCEEKLGLTVAPPERTNGGCEDFAYMMNRVRERGGKGLFFNTIVRGTGPAHGKTFDVDEASFPAPVKVFCGLVVDLMG